MHDIRRFDRTAAPRHVRFGAHAWADEARAALEGDLRAVVRGEVRFDGGSRALYSTAGSNYRQVPIGVVIPRDADDLVAAADVCRRHRAPLLGRGGGTSLAGQCCNVAVVIDCSKYMNRIVELDPAANRARVEPGLILDHLRKAAEAHHLTFGPDPSTHDHCTLGGMIGNNSCGVHSVMAGKTDDNIESLEILTYDGLRMRVGPTPEDELRAIIDAGGRRGEIYRGLRDLRDKYAEDIRRGFPDIPRRVSGYNLPWLLPEHGFNVARALVGSEGTCVMVLSADVRLVESPQVRTLVVLGYPNVYAAADDVPHIMEYGPIGLEGMDDRLIRDIRHIGVKQHALDQLPAGSGWLLVEFGAGSREDADAQAQRMIDSLSARPSPPTSRLFDDRDAEQEIWRTREAGLGATAHVTSDHPTWEGWEDSAVPPDRLGEYLRGLRTLLDRYQYIGDFYGHFGQGCLHTRINFDLFTADGIRRFRSFIAEAADLVVSFGGSISGEHGDGQSKAEMLPKMFSPALMDAFRTFKSIWDPDGLMNPGKVVDPYRIDENLRYGSDFNPIRVQTHFGFPEEHGNFSRATMRCVGVGECRRTDRGTMCPSFQVTREEKHSTRGRAHLLWEMLEGDPVEGLWQSEEVKEALDLCLACKGCKGDCPVHVDMATYKAEFLSHYYKRHVRPRTAWAFGLIHWWARIGSLMPTLVNTVAQTPGLSWLAKRAAGMPDERAVPAFAGETFRAWFGRHRANRPWTGEASARVVLWPDTFNDHFHPETAIAATELLESAGFEVRVPARTVCCGRPLYDYGLLPLAKKMLFDVLDAMRDDIRAGVPVIVLEPSCAAVFRDELTNMLPHDEDAKRLSSQVRLLAEFIQEHRDDFDLPRLDARVLYHGHCHQKAIFGTDAETGLLRSLGARLDTPDTGCCGMAGSFGFEAEHYDISRKVGERVLLPAVRKADRTTVVMADGFSCREQIAQLTDRRALHLAQLLRAAQTRAIGGDRPEQTAVVDHARQSGTRLAAVAAAGLVIVGAALALRRG
ncbi:MAG TPA: FAD-binding and (Fe-S)-binding domain-containing protein [Vicinamibacterales bacterium]|nr:FAD-binding and (Fe-S)-binding domain-containing protein [Vicinamibacterales bacterium]